MPIDFRCPQCGKLLQTPDNTAGRQAKCPQCGTAVIIPSPPAAAPDPSAPLAATLASPGTAANPFQASQARTLASEIDYGLDESERFGPPWEAKGTSIGSYIETAKEVLTEPTRTFSTMRRIGGFGKPLLYAIVGGMVGVIGELVLGMLGLTIGPDDEESGTAVIIGTLVIAPLMLALFVFFYAGILHLCLLLVGGAQKGFEATFRVCAYVSGSTSLLSWLPFIGNVIALVCGIAFPIIGLQRMHETSLGKAALAVFLPAIVLVALVVLLLIAYGSAMFEAIQRAL